jgi:hypothetical protein
MLFNVFAKIRMNLVPASGCYEQVERGACESIFVENA